MRIRTFLFIFLISCFAQADILMLDLNNSPSEYQAAKRAAEARGEKLIRIPPIDVAKEKEFRDASDDIWRAIVSKRKVCAASSVDATDCQDALKGVETARKSYSELAAKVPKVDSKMLSDTLGIMKATNRKVSSMIVSGHDGDRDFGGIWSKDLTESDIERVFAENEPVGDDVRSLLLWGCYTGTVADYRDGWKKAFKNLNVIGGFDAMGPGGDRPSNGKFLADVLKKEKILSEAKTKKDLEKVADGLEGLSELFASICVDRELIIQKRSGRLRVVTMADAHKECAAPDEAEQELAKQFQCYLNADQGCENPPLNPHTNVIRKYYEVLQKNRHCTEAMESKGVHRPHYAQARRLLFDNTVRSSFNRLYAKEMAAFNKLLSELGVSKKLRIKNLGMISRKDYLNLMRGLKNQYSAFETQTRDNKGRVRDPRVIAMGLYLGQIHKIEDARCVPLSWIEGRPEDNRCGTREALGSVMNRAEIEAARN